MSIFTRPGEHPASPDELPVLVEVVSDMALDDLPTLTEIVKPESSEPQRLSEADIQQLLQHLEQHIEIMCTQKIALHLEQMKDHAIEQIINELKTELPELLRNAVNVHPESR